MEEKTYKLHLSNGKSVVYYGEVYFTCFDHWTSVKATSEREAYNNGVENLMKQVAMYEPFGKGIRTWKKVYIDMSDLEIIG